MLREFERGLASRLKKPHMDEYKSDDLEDDGLKNITNNLEK